MCPVRQHRKNGRISVLQAVLKSEIPQSPDAVIGVEQLHRWKNGTYIETIQENHGGLFYK
jgi:hypothetical protein